MDTHLHLTNPSACNICDTQENNKINKKNNTVKSRRSFRERKVTDIDNEFKWEDSEIKKKKNLKQIECEDDMNKSETLRNFWKETISSKYGQ